jgi:hypothetical protein
MVFYYATSLLWFLTSALWTQPLASLKQRPRDELLPVPWEATHGQDLRGKKTMAL